MAYTNVTLPTSTDTAERHNHAMLKADRDFWRDEAERLARTLQNIPEAVEKYGYVTLDCGGETLLLAESATDPTAKENAS